MLVDKKLITNVLHNSYSVILPLIITIVTVPIYLKIIGLERYGVLSVIWLVFGYFGLFDFGLSRATTHALAKYGKNSSKIKEDIFKTSLWINLFLGLIAGIVFFQFSDSLIQTILHKSSAIIDEITRALPLVSLLFPFALISNVLTGRLEAEDRFAVLNLIQFFGAILFQILPLLFVYIFNTNLVSAVGGAVAARIITIVILGIVVRKLINFDIKSSFNWLEGKKLLKFGGWVTITNAISPLLVSIDQLLIGYLLGAKALPLYSIPFNFAMKALLIPAALTRALFPRMSGYEKEDAAQLANQSLAILAGVMALICAPAIILIDIALTLWIGPQFASDASDLTRVLLFGVWINAIAYIPYSHLQSQGRADLVAKYHAIEIIPFVAILYFFVIKYGLIGAAAAWSLRVTIDAILLFNADSSNKLKYSSVYFYFIIVLLSMILTFIFRPGYIIELIGAFVAFTVVLLVLLRKIRSFRK